MQTTEVRVLLSVGVTSFGSLALLCGLVEAMLHLEELVCRSHEACQVPDLSNNFC